MSVRDFGESGTFTRDGAEVLVFARMIPMRSAASALVRAPLLVGLLFSAVAMSASYPKASSVQTTKSSLLEEHREEPLTCHCR
jgi:hypothetical protein